MRVVSPEAARLRDVPGVETVTADVGASAVRLTGSMTVADVLSQFAETTYTLRLVARPPLGG